MVLRYGMSDRLGHVVYEEAKTPFLDDGERLFAARQRDFSEETAALIDEEVRSLLRDAFNRASTLLGEQREILERGANQLFERETLDEAALAELTQGRRAGTARAA